MTCDDARKFMHLGPLKMTRAEIAALVSHMTWCEACQQWGRDNPKTAKDLGISEDEMRRLAQEQLSDSEIKNQAFSDALKCVENELKRRGLL